MTLTRVVFIITNKRNYFSRLTKITLQVPSPINIVITNYGTDRDGVDLGVGALAIASFLRGQGSG